MLEFFYNCPKKVLKNRYIIEYKPLSTPGLAFNSEALHTQKCTHLNGIAFLLHPDLKKKKGRPTNPSDFRAKRANKPVISLGLIKSGDGLWTVPLCSVCTLQD